MDKEFPLMKCGHTANAMSVSKNGKREPCCVICGCYEVAETKPDLTGRFAKCSYRNKRNGQPHTDKDIVPSSYDLPFFEYKPNEKYDEYYCGCWGWS
jgi:hypothetical protein